MGGRLGAIVGEEPGHAMRHRGHPHRRLRPSAARSRDGTPLAPRLLKAFPEPCAFQALSPEGPHHMIAVKSVPKTSRPSTAASNARAHGEPMVLDVREPHELANLASVTAGRIRRHAGHSHGHHPAAAGRTGPTSNGRSPACATTVRAAMQVANVFAQPCGFAACWSISQGAYMPGLTSATAPCHATDCTAPRP